jgi:hypothetical protein
VNFFKYISENKDSEINGIPEYVATLHKNDFVKHNAANHKLTLWKFGSDVTVDAVVITGGQTSFV